jgi:hypothetical protein
MILTLQSIRGGLTTNRTFSYLTLSYRINELLGQSRFTNQKRYADYFEAYIGAAWVSASTTKDIEHVQEIENFLSQLFKPRIWPALESLTNGSMDLITAVQFDQSLQYEDGDDEVLIFEIPPPRLIPTKKERKGLKNLSKKERRRRLADITENHRQLAIADRTKAKKTRSAEGRYFTPVKHSSQAGPSRASFSKDRSGERKRISTTYNRVSEKSTATPRLPYATPIKAKVAQASAGTGSCKIYRLKPGDTEEEEIDMDIDSEWEDVQVVPDPGKLLTRGDRHVGGPGGTSGLPIVM